MVFFRSVLFAFLMPGLCLTVRDILNRFAKVEPCFLPAITATWIGIAMFMAGILNFMPLMVVLLVLLGLKGIVSRWREIIRKWSAGYWIGLAAILYLVWYCYKGLYADGDSLTHWGAVIREICELNRLPNFSTTEVYYQSYPTGIAGYIYFVCKIIGYSDGTAMFAQALLVVSLIATGFSWIRNKRSALQIGVFAFFAVYALHFNVPLDNLRVDNILSLLTLSSVTVFLSCRNEPEKGCLLCAPLLALLIITKNSALFWWLLALMPMVFLTIANKDRRKACIILCVLFPAALLFLWNCHIKLVFVNPGASRHSTSILNMLEIYRSKSFDEVIRICTNFKSVWFTLDRTINASGEWQALLGFTGVFACSAVLHCNDKSRWKKDVLVYVFVAAGYLLYKILLLGMYVFNMPDSDALRVAGYDRYVMTMTMVIFGFTTIKVISVLNEIASRKPKVRRRDTGIKAVMLLLLLILPTSVPNSLKVLNRPDYANDGLYRKLETIRREYSIPEKGSKTLVYTKAPYAQLFVAYCFRSGNAWCVDVDSFIRSEEETPGFFDYFIVIDHDDAIDGELVKRGFPIDEDVILLNTAAQ